jgi:hypothetical protein
MSAISPVPNQPGRERMDLHCTNIKLVNRIIANDNCNVFCHMGAITEDPKCWECHEYTFEFKHQDNIYLMKGHNIAVDPSHQSWDRQPMVELQKQKRITQKFPTPPHGKTIIAQQSYAGWVNWETVIKIPHFIPISTGDDMHEQA